MIHAVILDMDGTMYDTEKLSVAGWLEASCRLHCNVKLEDFLSFRGRSAEENRSQYQQLSGTNGVDYDELRQIRVNYKKRFIGKYGLPVKRGLVELLEFLDKAGLRAGVATGTEREVAQGYWQESGVENLLKFSVCGSEVTRSKPCPDIFLAAAKAAGERPQDCLVIEDSPNGIRAAAAAGCRAVMVPDLDRPDPEVRALCEKVCEDLLQVRDYLREITR